MSYLLVFWWFIPSYLDHWIISVGINIPLSLWDIVIFFFLTLLKRHYFKCSLLFQVKIFMIRFFLPKRDLAPILALPCIYMALAKTFNSLWFRFLVSRMNISFPYFMYSVVVRSKWSEMQKTCFQQMPGIVFHILDGYVSYIHLNCRFFTLIYTVWSHTCATGILWGFLSFQPYHVSLGQLNPGMCISVLGLL